MAHERRGRDERGEVLKLRYAITAALLASAAAAPAQISGGAGPPAELNERRLDIRPTLQLGYDSNVYRLPRGFDVGFSRDDIRVAPTLDVDIARPLGRQTLFLNGQIGYDFWLSNSRLNRERIGLAGGAVLRAGQSCSATTTLGYSRSQVNFTNVFATDATAALPNTEEQSSIDIQARCGGAIGLTPSAGFRHIRRRNSNPFFQPLDTDTDSYNVGIGYARPSLGVIQVFGSYATSEFPGRARLGIDDGIENYATGISFERRIGTRITGVASLGYSWVNPRLPGTPAFRGINYSLALGIVPSDELRVDLTAARSIDVQNFVAASYAITDLYALRGSYQLNRKLRLDFGSSYQQRDFKTGPDLVGLPGFFVVPSDKLYSGNVGFTYDLARRLTLTGNFLQERRDSGIPFFNYTASVATLSIALLL